MTARILARILVLAVAGAGLVWLADTVAAERVFHAWDGRFYHGLAVDGWRDGWLSLAWEQRDLDYSAWYTLPLAPALTLFGPARPVFITALGAVFVLPWILATAGLAGAGAGAGTSTTRPWTAALAGIALALTGATWAATLRGYPDAAGALAVTLALWAWAVDPDLRRWRTPLAIGAALAAAVLLRRHFAYAGLVVMIAMAAEGVIHRRGREIAPLGIRLAAIGGVILALLFTLAPALTRRMIAENTGALYAGYQRHPWDSLAYLVHSLGPLTLALGLAGLALAARRGVLSPRLATLLALFAGLWLALWAVGVGQNSPQYLLHGLPVVTAVGLGTGLVALAGLGRRGRVGAGLVALVLVAQAGWTFGVARLPAEARAALHAGILPDLLPPALGPATSDPDDHRALAAAAAHLQAHAAPGDRIFVIGSSGTVNEEALMSADEAGAGRPTLAILPSPHVDSRDWLPAAELAGADWVVLADPPGFHLPPEAQDVVTAAHRAFTAPWPVAGDYAEVATFPLADGHLRLFQRTRPPDPARLVDTIERLIAAAGRPGSQRQYVPLRPARTPVWRVEGTTTGPVRIVHDHHQATGAAPGHWIGLAPLSGPSVLEGAVRVGGNCPDVTLDLAALSPTGTLRPGSTATLAGTEGDRPLRLTVDARPGDRLVLDLTPAAPLNDACRFMLRDFQVVQTERSEDAPRNTNRDDMK